MKKILNLLLVFSMGTYVFAGDGEFSVSKIAPELLKDAHVVKRLEEIRFEMSNTAEAVQKERRVLTILDENGDDYSGLEEWYDKLHEITSIEGVLYDANGKVLKKMKGRDVMDLSGVSDISLMDANRRKVHNFYHKVYPYTVEYEVTTKLKYTLFFPTWVPVDHEHLSVEKSSIAINTPADYKVRFKANNYSGEPITTQEKNTTTLTWQVQKLPAIKKEYASPYWKELTTMVNFGPTDFEVQGYKGNMCSWQDFGKFIYTLNKGRDVLPDNIKQTVHQLTDGLATERQKIEALYQFLQQNTRYISIQLGIGGWQPFEASDVATKRYGDCKALSNYMYSLLKEVGIKSYYTLIRAGDGAPDLEADFPSSQFNHAILCVPQSKDTVWLECTSQTVSAGYMGDFTGNRYALLVDEAGGKLVRTPRYSVDQNIQSRTIKAKLDEESTLRFTTNTHYLAQQQDDLQGMINALSKDKVKKVLQEQLEFATYDLLSFDYKEIKNSLPVIDETLTLSVSNYANITGKRLFIVPNIMNRSHVKLLSDEPRKTAILLQTEYNDIDSVEIELPAGYEPEAIPQDVSIKSAFGEYKSAVKLKGNKIEYYRHSIKYSGKFPATDYPALAKYYEDIYKADRNKIVLVRKQAPKAF